MPTLESILARMPGHGAFLAQQEYGQRRAAGEQALSAARRAEREEEALPGILGPAGGDPEQAIKALLASGTPKAIELATKLRATTRAEVAQPSQPEIIKLTEFLSKLPSDHPARGTIEARIKQMTTRTPAVNVYAGGLTAGEDAQGNPIFVQPSGRPGVAPRVLKDVYPPGRPAALKAEKEIEENKITIETVEARIAKMTGLIGGGAMAGQVVGPLGTASRIGETMVGAVRPGQPTPAIDFKNEQALLLSDVRRLVEKDSNLSNQERERLYETLGGGIWQTPASGIRTLANVLDYVKTKKMTGPSSVARRGASLESAVRRAGWKYEPDKYDYAVIEGLLKRKLKGP